MGALDAQVPAVGVKRKKSSKICFENKIYSNIKIL